MLQKEGSGKLKAKAPSPTSSRSQSKIIRHGKPHLLPHLIQLLHLWHLYKTFPIFKPPHQTKTHPRNHHFRPLTNCAPLHSCTSLYVNHSNPIRVTYFCRALLHDLQRTRITHPVQMKPYPTPLYPSSLCLDRLRPSTRRQCRQ